MGSPAVRESALAVLGVYMFALTAGTTAQTVLGDEGGGDVGVAAVETAWPARVLEPQLDAAGRAAADPSLRLDEVLDELIPIYGLNRVIAAFNILPGGSHVLLGDQGGTIRIADPATGCVVPRAPRACLSLQVLAQISQKMKNYILSLPPPLSLPLSLSLQANDGVLRPAERRDLHREGVARHRVQPDVCHGRACLSVSVPQFLNSPRTICRAVVSPSRGLPGICRAFMQVLHTSLR